MGQTKMAGEIQGQPVFAVPPARAWKSKFAGTAESPRSGSVETAIRRVHAARKPLQESLPGEMPPLEPFEIVDGLRYPQLVCTPEEAPF